MIRTRDEWYEFCMRRGTSGDQVFDILKDWEEERDKKNGEEKMAKEFISSKQSKCYIPFVVELSFDALLGKQVTISLTNEEDIKRIQKYLDEGLDCHVLFEDYESI